MILLPPYYAIAFKDELEDEDDEGGGGIILNSENYRTYTCAFGESHIPGMYDTCF